MVFTYKPADATFRAEIGGMTFICKCGAKKFHGETVSICCSGGKVILELFPKLPDFLHHLFSSDDADNKHFLQHIRKYNAAFAMTSFSHKDATVVG